MAIYLLNHKHGCGCDEVEADSPEQAIEIRRSELTASEGDYEMFATLAEAEQYEIIGGDYGPARVVFDSMESAEESLAHLQSEFPAADWSIVVAN